MTKSHLTALAVLPACHLREGAIISVTTDMRQGGNIPDMDDYFINTLIVYRYLDNPKCPPD